jgi:hypothetical protein
MIICHSVKRKGPRKPYKFFITGEPYVNPIKHYASLHNEAKAAGNFLKNINSHGHPELRQKYSGKISKGHRKLLVHQEFR